MFASPPPRRTGWTSRYAPVLLSVSCGPATKDRSIATEGGDLGVDSGGVTAPTADRRVRTSWSAQLMVFLPNALPGPGCPVW